MRPLRVAVIASARYSVNQPFAGGLEAHTWLLIRGLRRRGHQVTVFASGSDPGLGAVTHVSRWPYLSDAARADVSMTSEDSIREHHAYLDFMLKLARPTSGFDIVHNNSIHYLPIAMAKAVDVPMVSTLHTPPTPWLESAIQVEADCPVTFVAVSAHTARAWRHIVPDARIVMNGVDLDSWRPGRGGGRLIWFGRIVPEKGPHLAIAAARRAGVPLDLVGPCFDDHFFRTEIEPELDDGITYLGHLDHTDLAGRVAEASAALITPCWEEPYGLVAAESLACATPVAGFARGALPEIVDPRSGVLVPPDDVDALARAIPVVQALDRDDARRRAESFCTVQRMLDATKTCTRNS